MTESSDQPDFDPPDDAGEADRPPLRDRLPGWVRWPLRAAEVGLAVVIGIGLALHLSVRDGWQPAAVVYYALPAMVLAAAAIGGLIVSLGRTVWQVAAIGIGGWAVAVSVIHVPATSDAATPSLRLMSWNTFLDVWAGDDAAGMSEMVLRQSPDLYAVIESGLGQEEPSYSDAGWRRRIPGYEPVWHRNRFMTLHREDEAVVRNLTRLPDLDLPPGSYHRVVGFELQQAGRWHAAVLVMMHPVSAPRWDRGPTMAALTEHVQRLAAAGPTIVCGDFNTPAGSALFDRLRETMRSSAEVAPGLRYRGTWPCPLPVLQLDQVWVSGHWRVHSCDTPRTWASDHEPVVVELSLKPTE